MRVCQQHHQNDFNLLISFQVPNTVNFSFGNLAIRENEIHSERKVSDGKIFEFFLVRKFFRSKVLDLLESMEVLKN